MKFQCTKADILTTVQQAQNIVGQKTTLQILSNLLIEAKGDELIITSTDLEIGLHSQCKVDVEQEGRTTVPARKFFDIIRSMSDKPITIETDDEDITTVSSGKSSKFRLLGLPAEDFPKLPDFSGEDFWEFKQSILKTIIKHTNHAISRDESRYVLNGIYTVLNSKEITAVTTDGRRLAKSYHSGMNFKDCKIDFILPTKAVTELTKLIDDEGQLKVYPKGNQVCFEIGNTTLITKLIEGNFPEYQAVIPESLEQKIILNKDKFIETLSRVAILTSDKTNSIKLVFNDNLCTITSNSPNVGDAREEIEVEYNGPELPIAFNPYYLIDILKCLESDTATIELTNALKPGVIKEGDTFLAVIMPMRLE